MTAQLIANRTEVRAARSHLRVQDRATLAEQVEIARIPAPSGAEGARARHIRQRFEEMGLAEVAIDEVGNVLGRSTRHTDAVAPVLVAAHLDSVFPADTQIAPRTAGERIYAPGITDNARGLAAMVALSAAMERAGIITRRPVQWIATVGEEGLGDLRGVKHLLRDGAELRVAHAFVALDGAGIDRIVHRAIGAHRLRATYSGGGGHSWGDRGIANPIHALGLAIARIRRIEVRGAEIGVSVGRVGGGTSVNSVPGEAWLEIDLRSDQADALATLDLEARRALADARDEEQGARNASPLALRIEVIGQRPSGETPIETELVQATLAATRWAGVSPELAASSTDANVPISLGIPAVAIGAGGIAGGVHTTSEWYDNEGGVLGIERALLVVLAAAGLDTSG